MIELIKPNKEKFYLNPFHIEKIVVNNYTIITLTNGKKYIVSNKIEEIKEQINFFWRNTFNFANKK